MYAYMHALCTVRSETLGVEINTCDVSLEAGEGDGGAEFQGTMTTRNQGYVRTCRLIST